jgi:hypothetical protein
MTHSPEPNNDIPKTITRGIRNVSIKNLTKELLKILSTSSPLFFHSFFQSNSSCILIPFFSKEFDSLIELSILIFSSTKFSSLKLLLFGVTFSKNSLFLFSKFDETSFNLDFLKALLIS